MNAKSKSKLLKIGLPIAVVLIVVFGGLGWLMTSKTRVAFLNIEEGKVEVDTGEGWQSAKDGMKLSVDDKVRTLAGKAVIVLYESIIIQLDENTEVSIETLSKQNTKIKQDSGTTWNKFTAIAGIQSFEVETPNTVATVRGTEFWVDMESVGVTEGNVNVRMNNKSLNVPKGQKAVLRENVPKLEMITKLEVTKAIEKKEQVVNELKDIRQQEIEKHRQTYDFVKSVRGWTDADVKRYLDRLDNGEFNEEEIKQKIVLPSETVDKFAKITREIREQKKQIAELKGEPLPTSQPQVQRAEPGVEGIDTAVQGDDSQQAAVVQEPTVANPRIAKANTINEPVVTADKLQVANVRTVEAVN